MWSYEKKLQYPVKIKNPNPALAKVIISQLGGPDGELGAATRYLQQRYSMPYAQVKGMLTDIGTEELAHIEMVSAILYQLTRNLTPQQIQESGFDTYFIDHTTGVYPQAASGVPFSAATLQVTGDTLTDLYEDLAAEQKARLTYDNILRLVDDPDVRDPIKFLRAREIVHFQRFGDALRITQENLISSATRRTPSSPPPVSPEARGGTPWVVPHPPPAAPNRRPLPEPPRRAPEPAPPDATSPPAVAPTRHIPIRQVPSAAADLLLFHLPREGGTFLCERIMK